MTKLALTLFNMVEETMIVLGPFDNIQLTYGVIRPFLGDRYTDMELVPDKKNFYRYKGKKYSDFRIEVFDADKHQMKKIVGYQIVSNDGKNVPECFYSYEYFVDVNLATKWLELEKSNPEYGGFRWVLLPIFEGDIEEPTEINAI